MSFIRSLFPASKRRRTDASLSSDPGYLKDGDTVPLTINGEIITEPGPSKAFADICHVPTQLLRGDSMRLILCQEDGQRVLFDSASIVPFKNVPGNTVPRTQISPCGNFQLLRRSRDVASISQMLFGAMPAATGTDSFKIHTITENKEMMISRMFSLPRIPNSHSLSLPYRRMSARTAAESIISSDSDSQYISTVRSLDGLFPRCTTRAMCMTAPPEGFARVRNCSLQLGDHGQLSGDYEENADIALGRAFSPPHRLSKTRRMQMSQKGNMAHDGRAVRWKSRSRLSSCGSQGDDDYNMRKVAMGVIWDESFRSFLFQHMALLETEMGKLEAKVEAAASHSPKHFLALIHQGWREFVDAVVVLANSPRLRQPVWLSMLDREQTEEVSKVFCDRLADLARRLDSKETQYFLSNLLSAVLMYHMSWVASVAPPMNRPRPTVGVVPKKTFVIGGLGSVRNDDAIFAPYNMHMAQYLEVVGSVGQSGRSARTIITGPDEEEDTVLGILHVLSYFIRCSSLQNNKDDARYNQLPLEEAFSPVAVSPCESVLATSPPNRPIFTVDSAEKRLEDGEDDAMSSCSADSLPSFSLRNHQLSIDTTAAIGIPITQPQPIINSGGKRQRRASMDLPVPDLSEEDSVSRSLGRSLLAGPTPFYSPHFVLSALLQQSDSNSRMVDALTKMLDDVRACPSDSDLSPTAPSTSLSSSQSSNPSTDPSMVPPENVIILADTKQWSVKVMSPDGIDLVHAPSEAVVSMLEQFVDLHSLGLAPKFLISHLEDSLSDILAKSLSLVEMVSVGGVAVPTLSAASLSRLSSPSSPSSLSPLSPDRVRSVIGCDHSDLRLILNVAAVYWPPVMGSVA